MRNANLIFQNFEAENKNLKKQLFVLTRKYESSEKANVELNYICEGVCFHKY